MIQVIDNAIPLSLQEDIKNTVISENFYWYFYPYTSGGDKLRANKIVFTEDQNTLDRGQLTHMSYGNSMEYSKFTLLALPILHVCCAQAGIEYNSLIRIKFNLLTQTPGFTENHYNVPHVDFPEGGKVLLYYINDCDGDTWLFNEFADQQEPALTPYQRVSPKQGRAVFFEADRYHASSNPITSPYRYVINFNFH